MSAAAAAERRLIAKSAADLLDGLGGMVRARRLRDAWPQFDAGAWRAMAGAGWPGSQVPEEQGGAGLAPDGVCALLEAAGGRLAPARPHALPRVGGTPPRPCGRAGASAYAGMRAACATPAGRGAGIWGGGGGGAFGGRGEDAGRGARGVGSGEAG